MVYLAFGSTLSSCEFGCLKEKKGRKNGFIFGIRRRTHLRLSKRKFGSTGNAELSTAVQNLITNNKTLWVNER